MVGGNCFTKMIISKSLLYIPPSNAGVTDIQTNVEAKTVVVEADPSVSPDLMLEKLLKVRNRQTHLFPKNVNYLKPTIN